MGQALSRDVWVARGVRLGLCFSHVMQDVRRDEQLVRWSDKKCKNGQMESYRDGKWVNGEMEKLLRWTEEESKYRERMK